jgi:hypothetical protein
MLFGFIDDRRKAKLGKPSNATGNVDHMKLQNKLHSREI